MMTCGKRSFRYFRRNPCTIGVARASVAPRRACGHPVRAAARVAWGHLPRELGFGSGITCWRRFRHRQDLGIWQQVHQAILDWLGDLDAIDWSRASINSLSVRAKRGGQDTGPNPTDRGKPGSKIHLLVDNQAYPWRCNSRGLTCTTPNSSSHWWTRCRLSVDPWGSPAVLGSGPRSSTPTKPMTTRPSAERYASAASFRGSHVGASTPASDSADSGG